MSIPRYKDKPKVVRSVSVHKETYDSNRVFLASFTGMTHSSFYSMISDILFDVRDFEAEKNLQDVSQAERTLYFIQVSRKFLTSLEKRLI
jgi:hypothetical protein